MTTSHVKDIMIERILRKAIALVVAMALTIPLIAPGVFAASSVSINCSDNIEGGETFTIAVVFSGGDVGRVDAQLEYDTDDLTYISGGTSKGDTGYVQLKTAGTEGAIVFNLKFQALTDGEAGVQVTTNEMYDLDERSMGAPSAYKTINIKGDASEDQIATEAPDEEQPEEETSLMGVDEKNDEDNAADDEEIISDTVIIVISAALALLIIIICILLGRRSKKKKAKKAQRRYRSDRYNDEYDDIENW